MASNADYGDPSPGDRKYLFITWKSGNDYSSGVVGENDGKGVNLPS